MKRAGQLLAPALGIVCLLSGLGCNQPPQITQVGDFYITDSFTDFLKPDFVSAPAFNVVEGEELRFEVKVSDPEDDSLVLTAGPLPMGASFDGETGVFTWTLEDATPYTAGRKLYVVATDPEGAWDSVVVYLWASKDPYYYYEYPSEPPDVKP